MEAVSEQTKTHMGQLHGYINEVHAPPTEGICIFIMSSPPSEHAEVAKAALDMGDISPVITELFESYISAVQYTDGHVDVLYNGDGFVAIGGTGTPREQTMEVKSLMVMSSSALKLRRRITSINPILAIPMIVSYVSQVGMEPPYDAVLFYAVDGLPGAVRDMVVGVASILIEKEIGYEKW